MKNLLLLALCFIAINLSAGAAIDSLSCDLNVTTVIENDDRDPESSTYPKVWDGRQWFSYYHRMGLENPQNRLTLDEIKKIEVIDYVATLDGKEVRAGIPSLSITQKNDVAYVGSRYEILKGDYAIIRTTQVNDSVFVYVNVYQNNKVVMNGETIFTKKDIENYSTKAILSNSKELAQIKVERSDLSEIEQYQMLNLGDFVSMSLYCNAQ